MLEEELQLGKVTEKKYGLLPNLHQDHTFYGFFSATFPYDVIQRISFGSFRLLVYSCTNTHLFYDTEDDHC